MSKSLKKLIDINKLREFKNKLVGAGSAYVQTAAVDQTIAGTKTFSKPIVGSVTGSSGSCTGNAATATKATQDSDGKQINTTYSKVGHTHDDRYYTEAEVNNLLKGKANTSGTYSNLTVGNASTAATAATATKLATARTIALSGAATGTATGFDGTANITIPVTALAASAIRAQWYAAYPDGAEAHNAMWGGRDITAAFNNGTVSTNIANGTFRDIFPGDYITKQITIPQVLADDGTTELFAGGTYTVNWVIADCDYWINKGDQGDTAMETHHVAIVPQQLILYARMNSANTTEGGYAGSEMYKKIIPACATGIVNAFGSDHILTFSDAITNSVDTSYASSGIPQLTGTSGLWNIMESAQCNLMSEKMVYGAPIFASGAMDNTMATRQMSAFRLSEELISYNRQGWWLRDVASSAFFALVLGSGVAHAYYASGMWNVRPFALLK